MSQPIIKRDDYWADFWNSLFMRPVYREPFPSDVAVSTPASSAPQASAAEASTPSTASPDLTESPQEARASEQHNPPKHAAESAGQESSPEQSEKFQEDLKAAIRYVSQNPESGYVMVSTAKGEVRLVHMNDMTNEQLAHIQQYVRPEIREQFEKRLGPQTSVSPTTEQPQDVPEKHTGRLTAEGENEVRDVAAMEEEAFEDSRRNVNAGRQEGFAALITHPQLFEQPDVSEQATLIMHLADNLRSKLTEANAPLGRVSQEGVPSSAEQSSAGIAEQQAASHGGMQDALPQLSEEARESTRLHLLTALAATFPDPGETEKADESWLDEGLVLAVARANDPSHEPATPAETEAAAIKLTALGEWLRHAGPAHVPFDRSEPMNTSRTGGAEQANPQHQSGTVQVRPQLQEQEFRHDQMIVSKMYADIYVKALQSHFIDPDNRFPNPLFDARLSTDSITRDLLVRLGYSGMDAAILSSIFHPAPDGVLAQEHLVDIDRIRSRRRQLLTEEGVTNSVELYRMLSLRYLERVEEGIRAIRESTETWHDSQ